MNYEMSEIQRAFSITPARLMQLYRARLLPEFDEEQELYQPGIYFKWGGTGGGRLWTPHGVFRLLVTLYLWKSGIKGYPIRKTKTMVFENVTNGGVEMNKREYAEVLKQRFAEKSGERKYIVISLGGLDAVLGSAEGPVTAKVVSVAKGESIKIKSGEMAYPLREMHRKIAELLEKAGLDAKGYKCISPSSFD